jgi:hypothetical protein
MIALWSGSCSATRIDSPIPGNKTIELSTELEQPVIANAQRSETYGTPHE